MTDTYTGTAINSVVAGGCVDVSLGCGTGTLPDYYPYEWERQAPWKPTVWPTTTPTTQTIYYPEMKAKMNEAQVRELREKAMSMAIDSLSNHGDYDDEFLKARAKVIFKFLVKTF